MDQNVNYTELKYHGYFFEITGEKDLFSIILTDIAACRLHEPLSKIF